MTAYDIRWIQRFEHYLKALGQLKKFIEQGELNDLEKQGLIQSFEYTFELAWNTLKDYFEAQGEANILGGRDAIRLAFKSGLIENGEVWMDMLKSRSLTSHTYNEDIAEKIVKDIVKKYIIEFSLLETKMKFLKEKKS